MTSNAKKDKHGNVKWYNEKDQLHRENGPAVEWADGRKEWWVSGLRHRENGPATESPHVVKTWYVNGLLHRENGPAVEWADGNVGYYINGQSSPEIKQQIKENMVRIQAEKEQQELFDELSQDHNISDKINMSLSKISKKL